MINHEAQYVPSWQARVQTRTPTSKVFIKFIIKFSARSIHVARAPAPAPPKTGARWRLRWENYLRRHAS
eukprot:5503894-Lingulodinium_polyedra.AAC.1